MQIERFRAMGTQVRVLGPDRASVERSATIARARFAEEEGRFSRFLGTSELTAVNRRAGTPTRVSTSFAEVLRAALDAAASTAGAFDPTVHDALIAAGYDRDFDEVLAGARGSLHPAVPCGMWREIQVSDDVVMLPSGVHLDLGGLAKGWTVDLVAESAVEAGARWVLVNAGGDLRVAGEAPPIDVGVEDPSGTGPEVARLRLSAGALATSSTRRRSWGDANHHIIDPVTGAPSHGAVIQATVWAPTCAEAEVRATVSVVTGSHDLDHPSVVVDRSGGVRIAATVGEAA